MNFNFNDQKYYNYTNRKEFLECKKLMCEDAIVSGFISSYEIKEQESSVLVRLKTRYDDWYDFYFDVVEK